MGTRSECTEIIRGNHLGTHEGKLGGTYDGTLRKRKEMNEECTASPWWNAKKCMQGREELRTSKLMGGGGGGGGHNKNRVGEIPPGTLRERRRLCFVGKREKTQGSNAQ